MHRGDKASPSISLAGCGHLVKMLMLKSYIFVMKTSTCFKGSYMNVSARFDEIQSMTLQDI